MEKTDNPSTTIDTMSGGATSIQGLFLLHHLQALQRLEIILVDKELDEDERLAAVTRISEYLLSLIVDNDVRSRVAKTLKEKEEEIRNNPEYEKESNNILSARLTIVTELCRYLSASLDILHHDVLSSVGFLGSDVDDREELDADDREEPSDAENV